MFLCIAEIQKYCISAIVQLCIYICLPTCLHRLKQNQEELMEILIYEFQILSHIEIDVTGPYEYTELLSDRKNSGEMYSAFTAQDEQPSSGSSAAG